MPDISGTISSNQTWSGASSPYNITGNTTINDGVTITVEENVQIIFKGAYTITQNGRFVNSGSNPITNAGRVIITQDFRATRNASNGIITMAAVDSGCTIKFWKFTRGVRVRLETTYNDACEIDKVEFRDTFYALDVNAPATFGDVKIVRGGSTFGAVLTNAADDTITVTGTLEFEACDDSTVMYNSGAAWTINRLVFNHCLIQSYGFRNVSGNDSVVDITRMYAYYSFGIGGAGLFRATGGSIRLRIHEGVVYRGYLSCFNTGTTGLTAASAFITLDAIGGVAGGSEIANGSVQLLNSYIAGYDDAIEDVYDNSADAGTVDATFTTDSSATPVQFNNVDAITGMRTTRRNPLSLSSVSISGVGNNSATLNFTPGVPCTAEFRVSTTSGFTNGGEVVGLKGSVWMILNSYDTAYNEAAVAATIAATKLKENTTYYYRVRCITPWGEEFWHGDGTGTFTTTSSAVETLDPEPNIIAEIASDEIEATLVGE